MGRATDKISHIADYQAAAKFYENTKHIRGRSEMVKPLGARKDIDRFNIFQGWTGDDAKPTYICTLYRTPVVKFRPNGDVIVRNGGYVTPSTHDFIRRVTNVRVETHEGSTVLSVANGKFKMNLDSDTLILKTNPETGRYEVTNGEPQHRYKIDRKGTTVIRKRYAEFIKYFDGMVLLRQEAATAGDWATAPTNSYVRFGLPEICEVANATQGMNYAEGRPRVAHMFMDYCNSLTNKTDSKYAERVLQLTALLNDTSDTQHESYHRAFVFMCMTVGALDFKDQNYCRTVVEVARESMLSVLYRWHNSESLTRVEMPFGELGSRRYRSWTMAALDEE
jgi:hypothetical protein